MSIHPDLRFRNVLPSRLLAGAAIVFCSLTWTGRCQASTAEPAADLTELSLEALMDIEVTSVSKRAERLSDAAAAVFVITAEDIRRSGVTSIPEALRMAPGVQVGRIDANKWAITARGFNGRFANKLLVLMDGRSVYTPLFSGVYWDVQDTLLEDIDRIEVIRGPGATLWGANAVNGVINIITKSTEETHGTLLTGGAGTEERGFVGARYGARVGEKGSYRLYAKYFNRDEAADGHGDDTEDAWDVLRAGFRSDWNLSAVSQVTVQGDIYSGTAGTTTVVPTLSPPFTTAFDDDSEMSGGNVLARWSRQLSSTSEMTFQTYYDRTRRDEPALLEERRDTFDLEFQHSFLLADRQDVVWGLGYRLTRDETDPGRTAEATEQPERTDALFSAFLQDDISLVPDQLRLILGSKFEHNAYSGVEVQPTGRFVWTPHDRHTVWTAVSRAVRTPSRGEINGDIQLFTFPPGSSENPGPLPVLVELEGTDNFDSEKVIALELGYRVIPTEALSLDLAGFVNFYDDLRSTSFGEVTVVPDPQAPHVLQSATLENKMDGRGYGFELAADWRGLDWWRLKGAYTYLYLDLDGEDVFGDGEAEFFAGISPKHELSLRSQMELPKDVELDLWLRYVDELPGFDEPDVEDYLTLNVRIGWMPLYNLELSLVGQNLLEPRHLEAASETGAGVAASEVERSVYAKITWRL